MMQVQVEIGRGFPVQLVLVSNGQLGFVKVANFQAVFDQSESALEVSPRFFFDVIEFVKDEVVVEEFRYKVLYDYKQYPHLLAWLKRQDLVLPHFE